MPHRNSIDAIALPVRNTVRGPWPLKIRKAAVGSFARIHAGDRPIGTGFASRSTVYGTNGAAGSAHPSATLESGDSLLDARHYGDLAPP